MVGSLRCALNDFYEEQEYKGNSPATLLYYRSTVERFLRQAKVSALEELTEAAIRKWLVSNRHLSHASLRTYDRALRVVTNWLHRRGYLAESPMKDLPKPASRATSIVTFTRGDVAAMLGKARRRRNPYRDAALIILLLDTGLDAANRRVDGETA